MPAMSVHSPSTAGNETQQYATDPLRCRVSANASEKEAAHAFSHIY